MATKKENVRDFRSWLNVGLTGFAIWVLQSFYSSYREDGKENKENWKIQQSVNSEFREYIINNNAKLENQIKTDSVTSNEIKKEVGEVKEKVSDLEDAIYTKVEGFNKKWLMSKVKYDSIPFTVQR